MVTVDQLHRALAMVQEACADFIRLGYFQPGVCTRFDQWIYMLPQDRKNLAQQMAFKAAQHDTNTGADVNGIALDQSGKPSLESLVLFYDQQEPGLFSPEAVALVKQKLLPHGGPRYTGPWPDAI